MNELQGIIFILAIVSLLVIQDNEDRPFTCARQRKTTDEEDEEHTGMYRLLWCDCGHSLTDEDGNDDDDYNY